MLAQVTAAVVAAFRTGGGDERADSGAHNNGKGTEDAKAYTDFQLAKLKGFCCVRNNSNLPTIWEYFQTTKEVDAQRTQLVEEMYAWAKQDEVQVNRSIYFDKSTMEDITRMEFCPGTPMAYLDTAEQGMSLLICRSQTGNETADIRSKEQAMKLAARNHTLTEAPLLSKRIHAHRLPTITSLSSTWERFAHCFGCCLATNAITLKTASPYLPC
jgi:hypothetical protein